MYFLWMNKAKRRVLARLLDTTQWFCSNTITARIKSNQETIKHWIKATETCRWIYYYLQECRGQTSQSPVRLQAPPPTATKHSPHTTHKYSNMHTNTQVFVAAFQGSWRSRPFTCLFWLVFTFKWDKSSGAERPPTALMRRVTWSRRLFKR